MESKINRLEIKDLHILAEEKRNRSKMSKKRTMEKEIVFDLKTNKLAKEHLTPTNVYRKIKNRHYWKETRLQRQELKNDKNLALAKVKRQKLTGVNRVTGKKSNILSRAYQKRSIKRNYAKALKASKEKTPVFKGTGKKMAGLIAQKNYKGLAYLVIKKIAFAILKPFLPFILKALVLVLVLSFLLVGCVALLSGLGSAFISEISEEQKEFIIRTYTDWETDLKLLLSEENLRVGRGNPDALPMNVTGDWGNGDYWGTPTGRGRGGRGKSPEERTLIAQVPNLCPVKLINVYLDPGEAGWEINIFGGVTSHDQVQLMSYIMAVHGEWLIYLAESGNETLAQTFLTPILEEIFRAQYTLEVEELTEERERCIKVVISCIIDEDGNHEHEYDYACVSYEFHKVNFILHERSLEDVLRERMDEEQNGHFDILNITRGFRQLVENPLDFNWWPHITSFYGYRISPTTSPPTRQFHRGVDIAAPVGTTLYATHTGIIHLADRPYDTWDGGNSGYGNQVVIRGYGFDGQLVFTRLAHMYEIFVTQGQEIREGDPIGTVGSTGDSTGSHLHLEIFRLNLLTNEETHLNPIFFVVNWTDDDHNENYRPEPGTFGARDYEGVSSIPPHMMSPPEARAFLRDTGIEMSWLSISQRITSGFGSRTCPVTGEPRFHNGIDIGATTPGNRGEPIRCGNKCLLVGRRRQYNSY